MSPTAAVSLPAQRMSFAIVLCFVLAASAFAEDSYMAVGGTAENVYFVPVAGSRFPNQHPATMSIVKLDDTAFPAEQAPITINPTTGAVADGRLPGPGHSFAVAPTSVPGKAKIKILFARDNILGEGPYDWYSVDMWVVVKCMIGIVDRAEGFPPSVPPTKTRDAAATITPSLDGTGHKVTFDIVNSGDSEAGTATVVTGERTTTGAVTVRGGVQSTPGHAFRLMIRARLDGNEQCGIQEVGFAVCAHATDCTETFSDDIDHEEGYVGLLTRGTWKSDGGGDMTELKELEVKERVRLTQRDNPPFRKAERLHGDWEPGDQASIDEISFPLSHIVLTGLPPKDETHAYVLINEQLMVQKCHRCRAAHFVIPKSGYKMIHWIWKELTQWKHQTTKVGATATVGEQTSEAGEGDVPSDVHDLP